jgi:hypothetical protein
MIFAFEYFQINYTDGQPFNCIRTTAGKLVFSITFAPQNTTYLIF